MDSTAAHQMRDRSSYQRGYAVTGLFIEWVEEWHIASKSLSSIDR